MVESTHTPYVIFRLTGPQLMEQTFVEGANLGLSELRAIRQERLKLAAGGLFAILSFIPHSVQFEISTTDVDHFRSRMEPDPIIALAVVADDDRTEVTTKVYFAFHQQGFPVRVFSEERPARVWLDEQLAQHNKKVGSLGSVDTAHVRSV